MIFVFDQMKVDAAGEMDVRAVFLEKIRDRSGIRLDLAVKGRVESLPQCREYFSGEILARRASGGAVSRSRLRSSSVRGITTLARNCSSSGCELDFPDKETGEGAPEGERWRQGNALGTEPQKKEPAVRFLDGTRQDGSLHRVAALIEVSGSRRGPLQLDGTIRHHDGGKFVFLHGRNLLLQCHSKKLVSAFGNTAIARACKALSLPGHKIPAKNSQTARPSAARCPEHQRKSPRSLWEAGFIYVTGQFRIAIWWRCRDLNPGHYGYEPYALTG